MSREKKKMTCPDGYYDRTNGNANWWACGASCPGGSYTDGACNCACAPNTQAPIQPVLSKQSQSSSAPVIVGGSLVLIILIILVVLYVKKYILNKNQG